MGPKTRGILINSPANPTGNLLSESRMAEIAQLGPPIISDEIYHGLVYGEKEHSILEFTDNAFVLNGFSKNLCHDGLASGLSDRASRIHSAHAEGPAEFFHIGGERFPVGRYCGPEIRP